MEKTRAIELLAHEVDKIPYLKTLSWRDNEFLLWLRNIENIIDIGLDSDDRDKFKAAGQFLRYVGYEEDLMQQERVDTIIRYEIGLKSIIQRHEILGLYKHDTNESNVSQVTNDEEDTWKDINKEFGVSKIRFGMNINFVTSQHKRTILFRDVEQAYILASQGYAKPAVILAGGVIEELLRLFLEHKNITTQSDSFDGYIKTCEQHKLLKDSVSRLSHSVRQFRNLVHLSAEETKKHTITKATAKGAVASIFTIANDF